MIPALPSARQVTLAPRPEAGTDAQGIHLGRTRSLEQR
jgi:hypothetical protein